MQGLIIVLIVLASIILVGIGILIFTTWRNRHNNHVLENLNPDNYGELNKLSEKLQEKLPVLDNKVENVTQILNSQSTVLPVMDTKIDSLQKTTATETSVELLQKNLTRLEELTNKLDKNASTFETKTDKNAEIEQKSLIQLTDQLGRIKSVDEKIATNLALSMNHTEKIPTLDSKVDTIKQSTGNIHFIQETLKNLNQLVDNLNKTTSSISSQSREHNEQNRQRLDDVQKEISDLTRIFVNDRRRGRSGELTLENFLGNYFGVKGKNNLWSSQYKITNINDPHQEIGLVDAVVFTPHQDQNIAIDAKFPTLDYTKIFDDKGKTEPVYKKEFVKNIKKKVDDLKKYINPDYRIASVIMFIPSDNIFYFIVDQCPEIMDYAFKEKIWLACPTLLMPMLSSQAQVVREHYLARNVMQMKNLIVALKDEFKRFDDRAVKLKAVYDRYIKDSNVAFKNLQTTQNKIANKVDKLESIEEDKPVLEPLMSITQPELLNVHQSELLIAE